MLSTNTGKDAATVLEGGLVAEEKKDGEENGTVTDASTPKDAGRLSHRLAVQERQLLEHKLLSKKHASARLSCAASTFQSHYDVNRLRFNSHKLTDVAEDESDGEQPKRHSNGRRGVIVSTEKSWRNFLEKTDFSSVLDQDGDGEDHGHGHGHGRTPWYSRPVQRQHWKDDQSLPHVNWGDLFFDLFYVGAAYNLGNMLISATNRNDWPRGVLYFVAIFGPLYNAWETSVFYASKYTTYDHTHRIVEAVRYFFVSMAVLHIKQLYLLSDPASMETLLLMVALFVESFIQLLLHLELLWVGVGDRTAIVNDTKRTLRRTLVPMTLLFLVATIIAGIFFRDDEIDEINDYSKGNNTSYKYDKQTRALGSASYSSSSQAGFNMNLKSDLPLGLCCIGYILNIVYPAIREKQLSPRGDIREHFVPKNIEYLIHRYGEWLMLMIGESVLSLLIVTTVEQTEYYALYSLGVLSVIALQMLVYESEPHVSGHALWRNLYTGFVYSVWIQILSMGLIVFGASYKVMLTTLYQRENSQKMRMLAPAGPPITPQATTWMFSGSLAIVLLSLELVFVSHEGLRKHLSLFVKNPTSPKWCEYNWPLVAAAAAKVTLILFVATIGLWTTKNTVLTGVAFAVILAMVALRATTIYYQSKM